MDISVGRRIRELREKKGMTLRRLAEAVGISAPFLSDVEHGRRGTLKMPEIASALGVPIEDLDPGHVVGMTVSDLRKLFTDGRLSTMVKGPMGPTMITLQIAHGVTVDEVRSAVILAEVDRGRDRTY